MTRKTPQARRSVRNNAEVGDVAPCGTRRIGVRPHLSLVAPGISSPPFRPRSFGQEAYVDALANRQLIVCMGPAGSGKTYLAICDAVAKLERGAVERIVLTRPAVEAGERLGFLPGGFREKVEPYLRPLFDALSDRMTMDRMHSRIADGTIEIAPLAYMRGRTLSRCAVVMDEAGNATRGQLSMFVSRIGQGSTMVVAGDPWQSDLPTPQAGGLGELARLVEGADPGVAVVRLEFMDVVRHPMLGNVLPRLSGWGCPTP